MLLTVFSLSPQCLLLVGMLLQAPCLAQEYTPLVPMEEYKPPLGQSADWRALDCWQCFEAQGRMCHSRDYSSLWNIT